MLANQGEQLSRRCTQQAQGSPWCVVLCRLSPEYYRTLDASVTIESLGARAVNLARGVCEVNYHMHTHSRSGICKRVCRAENSLSCFFRKIPEGLD